MISKKQKQILTFPYEEDNYGLICDGAIRTGKTIWCSISFILWAMSNFSGRNFGICSKTIGTAIRNVINPILEIKYMKDNFQMKFVKTESLLTIKRGNKTNYFYIFGGKDEASYTLIQGITLAGVLLDEVALMPRSFVEQALARCSVKGRKFYFNCNPEKPSHWFKQEWIDKPGEKKVKYLHFTMDDNPYLDEETKTMYRSLYTGVFYQRYIEGKWVTAEGAIYPLLSEHEDDYVIDRIPSDEKIIALNTGIDFGGSKSSTAFVTCAIGRNYENFYFIESRKIDSSILDTEILKKEFKKYIEYVYNKYGMYQSVFPDNAEPLHIRDLQNEQMMSGLPCKVQGALKEEITYRIQAFNTLFSQKRIKFLRHNKDLIQAFKDAVWDEKHSTGDKDIRLDDGSYCVDLLDASEYTIERLIDVIYRTGGMI